MTNVNAPSAQRIYIGLRYADAPAAIEFLCTAFGFERGHVYTDDAGVVAHAELHLLGNVIMLGSTRDDGYPVLSPLQTAVRTAGIYVALDDAAAVDALHARAAAAGAEIRTPPHDTDYGSHDFQALDREGHLWSFGTYRPEP